MDFKRFLLDMGEKPEGLTLDRIDNEKGYCKDNCRWATYSVQGRNKSTNRLVSYAGEKKTIADWSEILGWPHFVIHSRLREGWDDHKAITTPRRGSGMSTEDITSILDAAVERTLHYA